MKIKCIFCLTEQESSDEHVVPESIGGSLVIKEVCKSCNNKLSQKIDNPFAECHYVRMARFAHEVGGKRGNVPNSLAGPAETLDNRKVKLSKDLTPYLIRHVEETADGDSVHLRIEIDAKDEARLDEMIRGPLTAAWTRKNPQATPEQLKPIIDNAIADAKRNFRKGTDRPQLHYRFHIRYDDLIFEYLKIAYEAAFKLGGYPWIETRTAKLIRDAILQMDSKARIHGSVPCHDFLKQMLDGNNHYILMLHNMCYIKLFDMSGAIGFAEKGSPFSIPPERAKLIVMDYLKHSCKEQSFVSAAEMHARAERRRAILRSRNVV